MALTFPQNPTNGQVYGQYIFDSTSGTWKIYDNEYGLINVLATKANLSGGNTFSGYQMKPDTPSFHGQGSGGQINTNNVQLVFDNQGVSGAHNVGGHYNTSTGVFTAPVAGRYEISFYMLTNAPNMGNSSVQIMLRINGIDKYFVAHNHNASWVVEGMTQIFNLAANDYITFYQYRGSGHYGAYSSLSIRLLG